MNGKTVWPQDLRHQLATTYKKYFNFIVPSTFILWSYSKLFSVFHATYEMHCKPSNYLPEASTRRVLATPPQGAPNDT